MAEIGADDADMEARPEGVLEAGEKGNVDFSRAGGQDARLRVAPGKSTRQVKRATHHDKMQHECCAMVDRTRRETLYCDSGTAGGI